MKLNSIYFKLLLLFVPVIFVSCSKDDEGPSAEEKAKILSSNTWVIQDMVTQQSYKYDISGFKYEMDTTINVLEPLEKCQYDVDYQFLSSKIIQYTLAEDYCGEPINGNFTWELSPSGNELTIEGDEGALFVTTSVGIVVKNDVVLQVLEINNSTLKCRLHVPFDEFIGTYLDASMIEMLEEMEISISGEMTVDYTFVKK